MEVSRKRVVRQEDRRWLMLPAVISLFFLFFGVAALIVDPFERADPRGMAMTTPLIGLAALIVSLTLAVAVAPALLVRIGFFPGPRTETFQVDPNSRLRPIFVLTEAVRPARARVIGYFVVAIIALFISVKLPVDPPFDGAISGIAGAMILLGYKHARASWARGRDILELNSRGIREIRLRTMMETNWESIELVSVWSSGGLTDAPAQRILIQERSSSRLLSINISAATDKDRARLREEIIVRGKLVGGEGFEPPTLSV